MRRHGLHITPEMIEAAYVFLLTTMPFRRWNLPAADLVVFSVSRHKDKRGDWCMQDRAHVIRISAATITRLPSLIETVAHEMCHMRDKIEGGRNDIAHGRNFRRLAKQVCRYHGFEESLF